MPVPRTSLRRRCIEQSCTETELLLPGYSFHTVDDTGALIEQLLVLTSHPPFDSFPRVSW